jgi:3'-phosphoadenosine 5'-phosphosulfate sulfotransferase
LLYFGAQHHFVAYYGGYTIDVYGLGGGRYGAVGYEKYCHCSGNEGGF